MCEIVIVKGVLIANNDVFISLERLAFVNAFELPVNKKANIYKSINYFWCTLHPFRLKTWQIPRCYDVAIFQLQKTKSNQ